MPLIVAHRGASKAEKENTIAAFHRARAMGADMVELDVRRTVDGVLIVHHDAVVSGSTIVTMRADQLPPHVPGLADALGACEGMDVNIEIKNDPEEPDYDETQWVADQVVALLAKRADRTRMLISSFDRETINHVRLADPSLKTGFLLTVPELVDGLTLEEFMSSVAEEGHIAIHPHRFAATQVFVDAAHAHGLAVNVWTVDKPEELCNLAAIGVDALITNVPDEARAALS
jgi:glycerophosphoryl diester phosphodiesterase